MNYTQTQTYTLAWYDIEGAIQDAIWSNLPKGAPELPKGSYWDISSVDAIKTPDHIRVVVNYVALD